MPVMRDQEINKMRCYYEKREPYEEPCSPDGGCDDAGRLRRQCGYGRYGGNGGGGYGPCRGSVGAGNRQPGSFQHFYRDGKSQEQVSIIPLVSGEVAAVNFEVGDHVQAGDVLLQIDDEAARLQLESAKLTKEGAELSAQRTLGSSQVMSNLSMESNLKNIQYQIDMAKKQYDSAGTSIADTQQKKRGYEECSEQNQRQHR